MRLFSEFVADFVKFVQDAKKAGKTVDDVVSIVEDTGQIRGLCRGERRAGQRGRPGHLGRDEIAVVTREIDATIPGFRHAEHANASTHAGRTPAARPEPRRQASAHYRPFDRRRRVPRRPVPVVRLASRCVQPLVLRAKPVARASFSGMSNRLEYILHARTMSRLRSSVALDVLSLLLGLVAARGLVRERGRAGRRSLSAGPSNLRGESPKEGKPCCRGARCWQSPRLQPQRPFDVPGIQTRPPRNHQQP